MNYTFCDAMDTIVSQGEEREDQCIPNFKRIYEYTNSSTPKVHIIDLKAALNIGLYRQLKKIYILYLNLSLCINHSTYFKQYMTTKKANSLQNDIIINKQKATYI